MLSAKFEITGIIKQGASSENTMITYTMVLHNVTTQDGIVINAGANDVYKNKKEIAVTQIAKVMKNNYNTNITILHISHRYDVSFSSCVNYEIQEFYRRLKKAVNVYNHVSILETNPRRELFTRHRLHLNGMGR